mmetsp:Transcript_15360/g.31575  ORF Transcript_15360/g.31575 Transcript_15360/m.31575 type:complete len:216 (-) Transcript_15360:282-929(-)|eukprot:CAMPEP_0171601782 /NCGR_PEP_ID=MMETSP0990-20121206/5090_1 /TAXON_ID=483369 /ORGANISM="non described non described, Strain CCMP2098" /LENGTH=215 /DNA_ID=CAMNT_0012163929 /DNA_START=58 /DNA_END=705 /DNA_ORIENTATION=+
MPRSSIVALFLLVAGATSFIVPSPIRQALNSKTTLASTKEEQELFEFVGIEERNNPSKLVFEPRKYFYGRCSMELGSGYKTMIEDFTSSFNDESAIACVEVPLPLGMVIEESETLPGKIEVVEVGEGSNAANADIRVGDVLRACSAQKTDAATAAESNIAFNVLAGATTAGVEIKKAMYFTDKRTFEGAMGALTTNAEAKGGTGRVVLVLERETK